jgi:hypothetical protein
MAKPSSKSRSVSKPPTHPPGPHLTPHELAMLQRNKAISDSLEARKALMFKEAEDRLARFEEELRDAYNERTGGDLDGFAANLETGELRPVEAGA